MDNAVQRDAARSRLATIALWPGVPDDLPAAAGFFAARGWRLDDNVIDLTADLRGYQAPAAVGERPGRAGVSIEVMAERDRAEVLAFEAATFPHWMVWFERPGASVMVVRGRTGAVVGTLAARGAGVGSATVARASELLGNAGTRACHIGWTRRERFYAWLGYRPWRRYHTARRSLGG